MNKQDRQEFFQKTIEQNRGILLKVARTYCSNETDRQDLLQEMMIQIWRTLDRFDSKYKMSTWLYRISLNVAISFYRKNSRRIDHYVSLNKQTYQISEENERDDERQLKLLEQLINELKEIDKALMILYLDSKSHAEIAEIMGLSVSNVGTKVGRIKAHLKKRLSRINQR